MRTRTIHLPPCESFLVRPLAKALGINHTELTALIESGDIPIAFDLRSRGSRRATIRILRAAALEFIEKRQRATIDKRASKHARISPTRTRRYSEPADALMAILRSS
jgi:hypothetical protein